MSRGDFIRRLQIELVSLPKEEISDILGYYNEYFDEAGPENEEEVIREMGHPVKIANQIKADYAVKQFSTGQKAGGGKGITAVWWVVLGVLAAPVAFPVALACGFMVLALFIIVWAVAFALLVAVAALIGSGVLMIIAGISMIATNFASAILIIGLGFLLLGAMLLAGTGIVIGTRAIVKGLTKAVNDRRNRSMMKKGKEGLKNEE